MKIRTDFVTNSSSTSYVLLLKTPPEVGVEHFQKVIKDCANQKLPLLVMRDGQDLQRIIEWLQHQATVSLLHRDHQCAIWELHSSVSDSLDFDGDGYYNQVIPEAFEKESWAVIKREVE